MRLLKRTRWALAGPVINYRSLATLAFPLLKELRDSVQETVALNVVHDVHHVVVQVMPSPLPVRFVLDVGSAAASGDEEVARIEVMGDGAIETPSVREIITQIMEGGREAFDLRSRKYNFVQQ